VFEEFVGEVLLGNCSCPLLAAEQSADGWAFNCSDFDWRILSEQAPWHAVPVTHEALDAAFSVNTANLPPGYHFSVKAGQVYYKAQGPTTVYDAPLLDMLATVARTVALPDVEWVMHAWDHQKVHRHDPLPVFSFGREASRTDVVVPWPYWWDPGRHDFSYDFDPTCVPYAQRNSSRVTWRGGCGGNYVDLQVPVWQAYVRMRASQLSAEYPDLLDASVTLQCVPTAKGAPPAAELMDLTAGVCRHRHLLLLDGNTVSARSSMLLHAGAVLFKPDSVFSEWYYHLLRPWVHYVPVREYLEDLPEQARWLLHEAPPGTGECLARNAAAFARQHLHARAVACYWWRLLSTWARLQPQPSRTDGFAGPL